jgi:hypothetical protein
MRDDGKTVAEGFFKAYLAVKADLAVPIVVTLTIGGYNWKRARPRKATEIDLDVSAGAGSQLRTCRGDDC